MDIDAIRERLGTLQAVEIDYKAQLLELARNRKRLPSAEYEAGLEELELCLELAEEAIAEAEQELADAISGKRRLSRAQKKDIWHKLTFRSRQRFPYYPFGLTNAEYIVLRAVGEASRGKKSFCLAIGYIVKKYHISRSSVKATFKKLAGLRLLTIIERKKKGHKDNLPNRYVINCLELLNWTKDCFYRGGSENQPHIPRDNISLATEDETNINIELDEIEIKSCRQKARQSMKGAEPEALNPKSYLDLATGALDVMGLRLDNPTVESVDSVIDELWEELQPSFNPHFRWLGETRHGKRRTRLAFLSARLVKDMRLAPIPDKRPWNERETVKNVNRYLGGILKKERGKARPEITIGRVLKSKEIYPLPADILRMIGTKPRQTEWA